MKPKKMSILFVHGMWHAAWCWANFIEYFVKHDYPRESLVPLDLRMHGYIAEDKRVRWISLNRFAEDVEQAVKSVPRPFVVITHSLGGPLMALTVEKIQPDAVVLLAPASRRSVWGASGRFARHHPLRFLWGNVTCDSYQMVATPKLAKEMLFSQDMPEPLLLDCCKHLQQESYLAGLQMLVQRSRYRPWQMPVLVLGAQRDRAVSCKAIHRTAAMLGVKAEIIPGIAHDMMLDVGWEKVAKRVLSWMEEL